MFFKGRGDFITYAHGTGTCKTVVYGSTRDDKTQIELVGSPVGPDAAGDWCVMEGLLWLVDEVTPGDGRTAVTLRDPLYMFDRPLIYAAPTSSQTVGGFISATVAAAFISPGDAAYAMPYLSVSNSDTTDFIEPDAEEGKTWSLPDYLLTMRQTYNIRCALTFTNSAVTLWISRPAQTAHKVVFGDGHTTLLDQSFSRDGAAKVSVYQDGTTTDFFRAADGTISTTVPAARAAGKWVTITANASADPQEKAEQYFAKNANSHKIEFLCDRAFALCDELIMRLDGEVITSSVTYAAREAGSDWYHYKTGELAVTLSEKLKGVL